MRFDRYVWPLVAAVLLVSLAACASRAPQAVGVTDRGAVTVRNTLQPPSSITVSVVAEDGSRRTIGSVGTGQTQTLTFPANEVAARYRLIAEVPGGQEITSQPFTPVQGGSVTRDLTMNTVTVSTGG